MAILPIPPAHLMNTRQARSSVVERVNRVCLVWRFRSPHHFRGKSEMRPLNQSHTRSISRQCPSIPSSQASAPHNDANFGIGTLGFRLMKSTIQGLRQGRQMRGSFAPACRSELRYGGKSFNLLKALSMRQRSLYRRFEKLNVCLLFGRFGMTDLFRWRSSSSRNSSPS